MTRKPASASPDLSETIAREAQELRDEIQRHEHLYYVLDAPEITDAEYDALMRMQVSYDIAQTRKREKKIRVRRFHAPADVHA